MTVERQMSTLSDILNPICFRTSKNCMSHRTAGLSKLRVFIAVTVNNTKDKLTLRSLTLYIYGAPILDVSRSHTTTQHCR